MSEARVLKRFGIILSRKILLISSIFSEGSRYRALNLPKQEDASLKKPVLMSGVATHRIHSSRKLLFDSAEASSPKKKLKQSLSFNSSYDNGEQPTRSVIKIKLLKPSIRKDSLQRPGILSIYKQSLSCSPPDLMMNSPLRSESTRLRFSPNLALGVYRRPSKDMMKRISYDIKFKEIESLLSASAKEGDSSPTSNLQVSPLLSTNRRSKIDSFLNKGESPLKLKFTAMASNTQATMESPLIKQSSKSRIIRTGPKFYNTIHSSVFGRRNTDLLKGGKGGKVFSKNKLASIFKE